MALRKTVLFDWDEHKHEANLRDRGFGFDVAALIFEGETLEREDHRPGYGEIRVQAIGEAEGQVLFVVYTDREGVRRIVSARKASRKERARWRRR